MTAGRRRSIVLFDGDDTLWKTQELYAAATAQIYQPLEGLGFSCIWLYTVPGEGEREPSLGKIYVAFSRDRLDEILQVQANRTSADQVLWRIGRDHDGRGPEVND